jgi:hypothetical protein
MTVYRPGSAAQDSQARAAFKFNSTTSGTTGSDQKIVNTTSLMAAATQFTSLVTFSQTNFGSASQVWNLGSDGPNNPYFTLTSATNFLFQAGAGTGISAPIVDSSIFTAAGTYDASIGTNGLMSLWMNGTKAGTFSPVVGPINIGAGGYALGCSVGNNYYALKGSIYRHLLFNYVLPEAKIKRYSAGAKLDFEDIGGSVVDLVANGAWSNNGYTILTSSGKTISRAQTATNGAAFLDNFNQEAGKTYRVYVTISMLNGKTVYPRIQLVTSANASNSTLVITDSSTKYVDLRANASAAAGHLYIDNQHAPDCDYSLAVSIVQLGAVLDLEPESATPTVWHDESGNGLDGLVTGATLIDVPHFANTDYGRATVAQELLDSTLDTSYKFNGTSNWISIPASSALAGSYPHTFIVTAKCDSVASGYDSFFAFAGTSGTPYFTRNGSSIGYYSSAMVPVPDITSFHTYAGWHDGASTMKLYLDGVLAKTASQAINPIAAALTIGAVAPTAELFEGSISRALMFNYALDETKIRKYSAGTKIDWEDIGGSMVPINGYASDQAFSTNNLAWVTDAGWTINSGVAGKAVATTASYTTGLMHSTLLTAGKRYRLTLVVDSITAGNTVGIWSGDVTATRTMKNGVDVAIGYAADTAGTWVFEFTAKGTRMYILALTNPGTTTCQLDSAILTQLGCTLNLEPESATPSMWYDKSGNSLNGVVTGATLSNAPHFTNKQDLIDNSVSGPSYQFNGTSAYLDCGDSNNLSFVSSTSDMPLTFLTVAKNPAVTGEGPRVLISKGGGGAQEEYFFLFANDGTLQVQLTALGGSPSLLKQFHVPVDGQFHCQALTYDGNKISAGIKGYLDGVQLKTFASIGDGVYAGMANGTAVVKIGSESSRWYYKGQIARTIMFNYALDETKIRKYSAGRKLDYEDVGGSMTELCTNGALTGSPQTDWGLVGNITTPSGSGKAIFTGASGALGYLYQTITPVTLGKKYRLAFDILTKTNSTAAKVAVLVTSQAGNAVQTTFPVVDVQAAGTRQNLEFTCDAATGSRETLGIIVSSMTGGDVIEIDNISFIRLGAVLDLEPEGVGEGVWADSSPNKLNGVVNNAVAVLPTAGPNGTGITNVWAPGPTVGLNWTTFTPAVITRAKYRVSNGICYFEFLITTGTLTINAADTMTSFSFTLPVPARENGPMITGNTWAWNVSNQDFGNVSYASSGSNTAASAQFYSRKLGAGASIVEIRVSGQYFV